MVRHRSLAIAGLLALATAAPLAAQGQLEDWQNQWYWGAKGGLIRYTLPTQGAVARTQAGGEWLITARRAGLYVGYSTSFTQEVDSFPIQLSPGTGINVLGRFDAMQRIQLALLVFPWGGHIQPYVGGGFQIVSLSNPAVDCTGLSVTQCASATDTFTAHASGGFAVVMAGAQIRFGRLAIYGHAQISPQGKNFVLLNSSQSLEFGVRYAFLGSREEDVTTRR